MTSLLDLRKRLENLQQEVAQREAEEADAWDDHLEDLHDGVLAYAVAKGLGVDCLRRKNMVTLRIQGRDLLDVEMGYTDREGRGLTTWFGVATGKMRVSFDRGLPTRTELLGLINGILYPELDGSK